jgi:hypothetical protein
VIEVTSFMGKAAKCILNSHEKLLLNQKTSEVILDFFFKEIFFIFKKAISLSKYNHSEEI